MTPQTLKRLPRAELEQLWSSLRADGLPVGTFDGDVWPRPWVPLWWRVWRGKVFTGNTVLNRIGPLLLIQGTVALRYPLHHAEVLIDYPQLGLQDRLKPVSDTLWLGRLDTRAGTIWFSLEQVTS